MLLLSIQLELAHRLMLSSTHTSADDGDRARRFS